MNARTIRTLRNKFIKIFMFVIVLVMVFLGAVLNSMYYISSRAHIHDYLEQIVEARGELEKKERNEENTSFFPRPSFEEDFESYQFFTALVDQNGDITAGPHRMSASMDESVIKSYTNQVLERRRDFGRIENYYYLMNNEDDTIVIAYLNCFSEIYMSRQMVWVTVLICLIGLALTAILLRRFSYYIIKPELERLNSQKLFITNASHELKTPLAVIRANTEVQEMIDGETEWTQSTRKQVDRMDGLIKNLVMIARAQEIESEELSLIAMSEIVRESAEPFASMVLQDGKELVMNLEPDLKILADQSGIRQLTTLLVDNAFKYCDEKGKIWVTLDRVSIRFGSLMKNSVVRLTVSNSYAEGKDVDYSKFFDRFYREDESHNADRGGYGIGLSVAESLCRQYQGRIRAEWKNGIISFVCEFPLGQEE